MVRWKSTIGLAGALLLLVVGARLAPATPATAQSAATPSASSSAPAGAKPGDGAPDAAQAYDDFVAKLAANLGETDTARVDAALRTTFKQMVDERQAAGDLSTAEADALKQRIDSGDFPMFLGGGPHDEHGRGPEGHGGPGGDDQEGRGGEQPGQGSEPAGEEPEATATPTV